MPARAADLCARSVKPGRRVWCPWIILGCQIRHWRQQRPVDQRGRPVCRVRVKCDESWHLVQRCQSGQQIYVRDPQTGRRRWCPRISGTGNPGTGLEQRPVDQRGRPVCRVRVACDEFVGTWSSDCRPGQQIYVRDPSDGQTTLVSRITMWHRSRQLVSAAAPSISADGRFVAFVSHATNLVGTWSSGASRYTDLCARSVRPARRRLVSQDNVWHRIQATGPSSTPRSARTAGLSRLCQLPRICWRLVYRLWPVQQIYIRDRQLGESFLASQDNTNTNVAGTGGGGSK